MTTDTATDYPWCGATPGLARTIPNGGTIVYPPTVYFTDAVIFLRPSKGQMGKQFAMFLVGLAGGTASSVATAGDMIGGSREKQAEAFNEMLAQLITEKKVENLTSADVAAAFGDYAEVWQNAKIVKARLRKKGLFFKEVDVILVPDSGMHRGVKLPIGWCEQLKETLRKAFGSRFYDET